MIEITGRGYLALSLSGAGVVSLCTGGWLRGAAYGLLLVNLCLLRPGRAR